MYEPQPPPLPPPPPMHVVTHRRHATRQPDRFPVVLASCIAGGGAIAAIAGVMAWLTFFPARVGPNGPDPIQNHGVHDAPRNPGPPLRNTDEIASYLKSKAFPNAAIETWQYFSSFRTAEVEYTTVLRLPVDGVMPSEQDRRIPSESDYTLSEELRLQREEASEKMIDSDATPRIRSSGRVTVPNKEEYERARQRAIEIEVLVQKEREQGYRKMMEDYERLWKPWTPELPPEFSPHMSRAAAVPYWKNAICITQSLSAKAEVDSVNPADPYGTFAFRSFIIWGDKRLVEKAKAQLKSL